MSDVYLYIFGDGRLKQNFRRPIEKELKLVRAGHLVVVRADILGFHQLQSDGTWHMVEVGPFYSLTDFGVKDEQTPKRLRLPTADPRPARQSARTVNHKAGRRTG